MSFTRKQGKTKFMYFPVTVSTEIDAGSLVVLDSGQLIAATSTTAGTATVGVLRHTIASTDADYATERNVEVQVPVEKNVVWEGLVTASLATTSVGTYLDLTNAYTVNPSASTYDIAYCTKYISTTKGEFVLNIGPESLGVQ